MRLPTALALVAALAVAPVQSYGLDRACVAYMEADAAFEEGKRTASAKLESSRKRVWRLLVSAIGELMATEMVRAVSLAPALGEQILDDYLHRTPRHVSAEIREALVEVDRQQIALRTTAMRELKRERWEAHRAAYRGPTSEVESVMRRLVSDDRLLCGLE